MQKGDNFPLFTGLFFVLFWKVGVEVFKHQKWRNMIGQITVQLDITYLWRTRNAPHRINVTATRIQPKMTRLQNNDSALDFKKYNRFVVIMTSICVLVITLTCIQETADQV